MTPVSGVVASGVSGVVPTGVTPCVWLWSLFLAKFWIPSGVTPVSGMVASGVAPVSGTVAFFVVPLSGVVSSGVTPCFRLFLA